MFIFVKCIKPLCVPRNLHLIKSAMLVWHWEMESLFISTFVSSPYCFEKKALVSLKAHYILQNLFISEALIAFYISEKRHD